MSVIDQALQAIAEPKRRAILLHLVRVDELPAGEIASYFDVTRPAISQHLRVLTDSGLVRMRKEGTRRLYSARPEGLDELKAFLEQFWDDRLSRLARAAEAEEGRSRNVDSG